ncbi:MAG: MBOAT family protein [Flavobacteriales bacterium]|nr:MBOAT family protein [Flavobacteriales bacterium]
MLFNSIEFILFFIVFFVLYWSFAKNLRFQNALILLGSYLFYGWWDYRFLGLIVFSTIVDFVIGNSLGKENNQKRRKLLLITSLVVNLGLLSVFKYYNFFIDSWLTLLSSFDINVDSVWTLNIILPVGISFYTFQTLSYTIDIYRKKLEPSSNIMSFASFVAFFPQLVAGPIERAANLLPQMNNVRKFDYKNAVAGMRLCLWGIFKKVFIADSLAVYVNDIFANYHNLDGGVLMLGAIFFSIQIYCDFSGYSDIAIGLSKLLGFELMSNFKFPFFSRSIAEFWRRWHVSLSTWFKDYLFIPLGGSKGSQLNAFRNILIIFVVSGFWHGANWTFIAWGALHALFYLPSFVLKTNQKFKASKIIGVGSRISIKEIIGVIVTFIAVAVAFVIFRSETISDAYWYLKSALLNLSVPGSNRSGIIYVIVLLILDWFFRKDERNVLAFNLKPIRYGVYFLMCILVLRDMFKIGPDFIYFQF